MSHPVGSTGHPADRTNNGANNGANNDANNGANNDVNNGANNGANNNVNNGANNVAPPEAHGQDLQAELGRITGRIPNFWPDKPGLWFLQLEAQFSLSKLGQN